MNDESYENTKKYIRYICNWKIYNNILTKYELDIFLKNISDKLSEIKSQNKNLMEESETNLQNIRYLTLPQYTRNGGEIKPLDRNSDDKIKDMLIPWTCIKTFEKNNYTSIKDVNIIVPNKVVEVTFADGSKQKSICADSDTFSLEMAISICLLKKILGGTSAYNKTIKDAIKLYNNKIQKVKEEKTEKERIERKEKKLANKRAKREANKDAAEKERLIEIQKEAIIRANKDIKLHGLY